MNDYTSNTKVWINTALKKKKARKPPPLPSFSLQPCRSTTNMLNKLQVTILETLLIIIAIIVTAQYFGLLWWYYFYRELSYFNSTIDQSIEISLGPKTAWPSWLLFRHWSKASFWWFSTCHLEPIYLQSSC